MLKRSILALILCTLVCCVPLSSSVSATLQTKGTPKSDNKTLKIGRKKSTTKQGEKKNRNAQTKQDSKEYILFNSDHDGGNHEIFSMNVDGSELTRLTKDKSYHSTWARMSPDKSKILFQRSPASGKGGSDYWNMSLWLMDADGKNLQELRAANKDNWAFQGHTEWSPDGSQLLLFGGPQKANPQLYVTDVRGTRFTPITKRSGQNLDPSYSPDGEKIVFVSCPSFICFESSYEIYMMNADGSDKAKRLTKNKLRDHDPYFSPDGKNIAWLTQTGQPSASAIAGKWGIQIMELGENPEPRMVIDDGHINSYPAFSTSGEHIYFHRLTYGGDFKGFHIYRIGLDGKGLTPITANLKGNQEYPNVYSK